MALLRARAHRIVMEQPIMITWLNDFVFCPLSIYFHNLYGSVEQLAFQETTQINGTAAHAAIDGGNYSTRSGILSGQLVYCEEFGLIGKIDIFDTRSGVLTERKKRIITVYDGYTYQLYGQCFALREMGYDVKKIKLHSLEDNRSYPVPLPEESPERCCEFRKVVCALRTMDMMGFIQENATKCLRCIYEPLCDRSLSNEGVNHA